MSDLWQARKRLSQAGKAWKASLVPYKEKNAQNKYTCVWFTYICALHWFRKQADNYNGDDRDPEENKCKVHVMDLGYDWRASVLLTTPRLQVREVQDHANSTYNEPHNHTPEGTLKQTAQREDLTIEIFGKKWQDVNSSSTKATR